MGWNIGGGQRNLGNWASNFIDAVVPGRIERFLPLPRYHPWLFGVGMMAWGMSRQAAIMKNSSVDYFGIQFPLAKNFSSGGGMLGRGTAMDGFVIIGLIAGASALGTLVQEAN